jgi:aldose sugar dehydrogenase
MRSLYFIIATALFPLAGAAQSTAVIGTTSVTIDTLNAELDTPWEMRVEGQTHLWVTERPGRVNRIDLLTGVRSVVLDLTDVVLASGEAGMLGLALHPQFSSTPEVFIVYTYGPEDNDGYFNEKLVKYTWNGAELINEVDLITGIRAYDAHNGSRLMFLPDNTLLMSTGEQYIDEEAQDMSSLSGKYLRLNADGTIPSDNPFPGSYVFTLGHRNSQGIVMLPNGKILISEHGPSTDDEISVLSAGQNYGWPYIHGFCDENFEQDACDDGIYTEPIHAWTPTIATSDLVYYQNPAFPEWNNRLLVTTLNGQRLVTLELNNGETDVLDEDAYFQNQFGRLRDIAIGPNNEIFLATNQGAGGSQAILRVVPPSFIGLEEFSTHNFLVYPNPVNEYIKIQHDLPYADLFIIDESGREVYSSANYEPDSQTQLVFLQPGFYYANLMSNGEVIGRQKILKL